MNAFVEETDQPLEILVIGQATEDAQRAAIARTRYSREEAEVSAALDALAAAAADPDAELLQPLLSCARARCTGGEVTRALQGVFGPWRETPNF